MLGPLDRMLLREIMKNRGQFLAAASVIFFGISMFVSSFMSYYNLRDSVTAYYERFKLLDYYAEARSITPEALNKIRAVPGVDDAAGRVTAMIGAFVGPDGNRRVSLKLISVPDRAMPRINALQIMSGGYFDTGAGDLCLLSSKFADAHKLSRGSRLRTIINLKTLDFRLSGTVASPEFVLAVKGPFSPVSDDFGIVYVKESEAQKLFGYENTYNEVHVRFTPGCDRERAVDVIEKILKPYGFMNGTERKKQFSYMIINDEISHLEKTAIIFPSVFLFVAAVIIYVMQKRIINNQRTQIGVMKAFGYSDLTILWYYVKMSLSIALSGAVPALFAGYYLGTLMGYAYNTVFSIPDMLSDMDPRVVAAAVSISCGFCLAAGFNSARRVLAIQPAQAMRVEAPESGRAVLLEYIPIVWRALSFGQKMIVRNLFRNPQRSLLTIFGVAATIMFFMISMFFMDSIDFAFTTQFFDFQRQDYRVIFSRPVARRDAMDLQSIRGVRRVETTADIPVDIYLGWVKKETLLSSLSPQNNFLRLIDENGQRTALPDDGILVSHMIAEKGGIKAGDRVTVRACVGNLKVKESSREIRKEMVVAGIAKQYAGINCFASERTMRHFMEEGDFATAALVKIDRAEAKRAVKEIEKINAVEVVEGRVNSFDNFMEQMKFMRVFVSVMVAFGAVMGFAIIFNSTIINIMERSRELASLKVLGYTINEIQALLFAENILLSIAALLPGVLMGKAMCHFINTQFSNDMFALEVIIYPRTYIFAFTAVFVCATLAQLASRGNIRGLDMVEVLKSRE